MKKLNLINKSSDKAFFKLDEKVVLVQNNGVTIWANEEDFANYIGSETTSEFSKSLGLPFREIENDGIYHVAFTLEDGSILSYENNPLEEDNEDSLCHWESEREYFDEMDLTRTRCNNCMTVFESDDELEVMANGKIDDENTEFIKACPHCKTDGYLMDIYDLFDCEVMVNGFWKNISVTEQDYQEIKNDLNGTSGKKYIVKLIDSNELVRANMITQIRKK